MKSSDSLALMLAGKLLDKAMSLGKGPGPRKCCTIA